MEETTTDAATQDTGVEDVLLVDTQPEEQPAEAVTTTDSEPTPTDQATEETDTTSTTSDDDLSDYWNKKGIDISTPEGQMKAAQSYREAERAMHAKSQKASQLAKQLTEQPVTVNSDDELVKELAQEVVTMKRAQTVEQFKSSANLSPEQEDVMVKYLADNPGKVQLVNAGYMTLQDVYQLSGAATPDVAAIKKQGGQEALETLANKQRSTAVQGNAATTATPKQGDDLDDLEARLANYTF